MKIFHLKEKNQNISVTYIEKKILVMFFYLQIDIFDLIIVIASYYRQLSVDIKMKNYMIKTSFVDSEGPKTRANITGINVIIL